MMAAKKTLLCIVLLLHIWTLPPAHEAAYEVIKCCIKRDATPTMQQLTQLDIPEEGVSIRIMDTIGSDYDTLGTYLLDDKNGGIMKMIKRDYRLTEEIVREIFHRWIIEQQQIHGNKTNTWEILVRSLKVAKLMALADKIESILEICSENPVLTKNEECTHGYGEYDSEASVHRYGDYKNKAPVQGYRECKYILYEAPIEINCLLQHSLLMTAGIIGATITAILCCHCRKSTMQESGSNRSSAVTSTVQEPGSNILATQEPRNNTSSVMSLQEPGGDMSSAMMASTMQEPGNNRSSIMTVSTVHEPRNIMDSESDKSVQAIQVFIPQLITAISKSKEYGLKVVDRCFSEGIITRNCYASILKINTSATTRARLLLLAVMDTIANNNNYFHIFLDDVLKIELNHKDSMVKALLQQISDEHPLNKIFYMLSRRCSVIREPEMIQFSGRLATKTFLRIDKAFQVAIHGGQVTNVESAAKLMLKLNSDFQAIGLLYRASCRALIKGQLKKALKDCDRAMKAAKPTECQNGILIALRALRMKTSILRTMREYQRASHCLREAYDYFNFIAPSYDTAALLYEKIRLKMSMFDENVTFSELEVDYTLTLKHADGSCEDDLPQVVIFLNSKAEVLQKSSLIRDGIRPSPPPTEKELCKAEKILKCVPINKLPEEAYVYRGWHYLARSDLHTWRKQYVEAKKWAKKSQQQFARGGVTYVDAPQKRLKLLEELIEGNESIH